nr:transposase family protein [Trichormus azollae]
MFYWRKMPTFEVLGLHFGISRQNGSKGHILLLARDIARCFAC